MKTVTQILFVMGLCSGTRTASAEDNPPESSSSYSEVQTGTGGAYLFGWIDYDEAEVKLRGGTTTGVPVRLDLNPSEAWERLGDEELSERERDRAAILAMAGDYRVSFDFMEVEVYGDSGTPSMPYRSWGTEQVLVLEDTQEKISLQHLMVMFYIDDEGVEQGPMVVKHWRQDWFYEPERALEFIGESQWRNRAVSDDERQGKWLQVVYQVDDGPRYSMLGKWSHNASFSAWDGAVSWRPLPRRERTIRSDYQATAGTHRITIYPRGWVHTQDNQKVVLQGAGELNETTPVVAREWGVSRYDRIVDFDFSAGESYWEKSAAYWSDVRSAWDRHLSASDTIRVASRCDDDLRYAKFFAMADKAARTDRGRTKQAAKIEDLMSCVITPEPANP